MARWHPHISLWTSKTGFPISPTTSRGFLAFGAVGMGLGCVGALLMVSGEAIGLVPFAIGGWISKDAWGWFASAEEERTEYLGRVAAARTRASTGKFALPPAVAVGPLIASGATLLMLITGAAAFVLSKQEQVLALVASLYLGGFAALCWLDVVRTWLRAQARE